jgi:hypothetical protein
MTDWVMILFFNWQNITDMKIITRLFKISLTIVIVTMLYSCATFNPGWKYPMAERSHADPAELLERAHLIELTADTREEVESLIIAFEEVEKADPKNYYALWKAGNYHILMGAAYADKRKEKKHHYREAIKYCEKAMYTNEAFKRSILEGAEITEASKNLTLNEIDAMGYWYTARFYYFSECLRPLGRVFNTKIVIENNKIIEQIDQLNPEWAGGGNYFSRGLYYISIPERFGGSKERAEEEFSTAVQVGPDYLVNRWGRAKYLYQLLGDEENFAGDLEWVLTQDPQTGGNPYPWNVYFQEDARKLLAEY